MQQTASIRENSLCLLYYMYIYMLLLKNILLFSPVLSLDHWLPNYLLEVVLYTTLSKPIWNKPLFKGWYVTSQ